MIRQDRSPYIDQIINRAMGEQQIHGAQVGIYQGEQVVVRRSYGDEADTIYRIYSMTKPVTAVAVMSLYERGFIDLLEPAAVYLPEFSRMKLWTPAGLVDAKNLIRIKDLLNMTSGICYPDQDEPGQYMKGLFEEIQGKVETPNACTTREIVKMIADQPLSFEPGTAWRYGFSADVLGAIIEVITGKSFRDYLKETIFNPLEMNDTDFWVPPEKQKRLTELYTCTAEKGRNQLVIEKKRHLGLSYGRSYPKFCSGGAGLFTTLEDYSKFARMLACKGVYKKVRILSPGTVDMFTQDQTEDLDRSRFLPQMEGYGYSNLMRVCKGNASGTSSAKGEFGWDGWTGPYCSIDIGRGFTFLTMTQVTDYQEWSMNRKLKAVANSMLL